MKLVFAIGLVLVVLGGLSFFIPIPHTQRHGIDAGDIHIGVDTHSSDLAPPAVSIALLVVGAGMMIAGRKG